jgi:hypothetical protein
MALVMAWDRDQWWALVYMVMKKKKENFLNN